MESNNSKKPEFIGITSQSDTQEVLNKLVASLEKQGFRIQQQGQAERAREAEVVDIFDQEDAFTERLSQDDLDQIQEVQRASCLY